jgi:hypothetical protein
LIREWGVPFVLISPSRGRNLEVPPGIPFVLISPLRGRNLEGALDRVCP